MKFFALTLTTSTSIRTRILRLGEKFGLNYGEKCITIENCVCISPVIPITRKDYEPKVVRAYSNEGGLLNAYAGN